MVQKKSVGVYLNEHVFDWQKQKISGHFYGFY